MLHFLNGALGANSQRTGCVACPVDLTEFKITGVAREETAVSRVAERAPEVS